MAHGHLAAEEYTLGRLHDEAAFIVERENSRIATEAALIQLAVTGILSSKARSAFTKRMKALNVEVSPQPGLFDTIE